MNNTSPFWEPDWKRVQAPLSALRRQLASFPSPPLRIMKVSQLDADLLDEELLETMKEQLWSAFALFKVSTFFFFSFFTPTESWFGPTY